MNRRGFFGLLAAVALLPKLAVGQLRYTSYTFRENGRVFADRNWRAVKVIRIVEEDIYGKTRLMEARWKDVYWSRVPVGFRKADGRKIRMITALSKGCCQHICRWTESTA